MSAIKELNEEYNNQIRHNSGTARVKLGWFNEYKRRVLNVAVATATRRKLTPAEATICVKFLEL